MRTAQEELDDLADKFLEAVASGNKDAMPGYKELGDRIEGKPAQSVAVTGEDGGPIETSLRVVFGRD